MQRGPVLANLSNNDLTSLIAPKGLVGVSDAAQTTSSTMSHDTPMKMKRSLSASGLKSLAASLSVVKPLSISTPKTVGGDMTELRRTKSANNLMSLAMATTPKRGQQNTPWQASKSSGLRQGPPKRTASSYALQHPTPTRTTRDEKDAAPTAAKRSTEMTELRRTNSANNLRCLAMASTPKRGQSGTSSSQRNTPGRASSSAGLRRGPPRRTASTSGLCRATPAPDDNKGAKRSDQTDARDVKPSTPERASSSSGLRRGPPRRTASTSGLCRATPAPDDNKGAKSSDQADARDVKPSTPERANSSSGLRRGPPRRSASSSGLCRATPVRNTSNDKNTASAAVKDRTEMTELRRTNSANSLRCLAMASTPKRSDQVDTSDVQRSTPDRTSSSSGLQRGPPRRTASSSGLCRTTPTRSASSGNLEIGGRKVICSSNSIRSGRALHSKEDTPGSTAAVKNGIPGSIRLERRKSCGGRLNTSTDSGSPSSSEAPQEPSTVAQDSEMDDSCSSVGDASLRDDYTDDDDSSCSSSSSSSIASEDYDLTTGLWSQESAPLKVNPKNLPTRSTSKDCPMRWKKDDGSYITQATPDELQMALNEGINLAAQKRSAALQQQKLARTTSTMDGTQRTAASSTGSASVELDFNSLQITVVYQPAPKDWQCLCGEENDHDYKFCGMCAIPQYWGCNTCRFQRNKCRNVCCGGCGARRMESNAAA